MACSTCNSSATTVVPAPCPPLTPCPSRLCQTLTYSSGGWTYTEVDGCTSRVRNEGLMVDGVYSNAIVTVFDGEVVNVQQGSNVLQQRPEPCSSAAGSTPTPTSTTALSTAPCNLLTGPSTALYAGVVVNQAGSNIAITGCGTAVSPFTFNSGNIGVGSITTTNLSVTNVSGAVTLNTSGVNNSTCGYNIVDGQVRTWTNPITTLVAGRGVSVAQTAAGVNCSWTVDTKNDNKTIVGVSCGSAFVNPASGALPANSSWVTGSAVVYGTRLFLNTPTPATVYSAAGGVLASAPTMLVYASNALALAALDSVHTFSGTTPC